MAPTTTPLKTHRAPLLAPSQPLTISNATGSAQIARLPTLKETKLILHFAVNLQLEQSLFSCSTFTIAFKKVIQI